jgi:3-hydroxyisobutyrate dehydrogenase-like beta-hydroxyacid dehydrogenase
MASSEIRRVGYIGLGIMGRAMALNLMRAGFEVTVWNRTPGKALALGEQGAAVALSPAAVAEAVEVVCVNVTDTPDVEAVLLGPAGVVEGARPGLVVIDHSTIDPVATQRMAAALAGRGVTLLDAPVSGGDVGAKQGTLSIMVGGESAAFARCRPVLEAMGKSITHVGGSGMGQACKACNQAAVACTLQGVCEALALGERLGLDLGRMLEVVGAGAGGSWQLSNLGPKIVAGDFSPGFMIDLVLKDLRIVMEAGEGAGLTLDGVRAALRRFEQVQAEGGGRLGTQAMAKAVGVGVSATDQS